MATNTGPAPAVGERQAWDLAVERGPDWLFVRLENAPAARGDGPQLTEAVWDMIREHHASRVVLELDRVEAVDEQLIDAIGEIGTRVRREGGLIRTCGLSPANVRRLEGAAAGGVPHFGTRSEAVGTRCGCGGRCE
jgi:hypothetical protein